MGCAVAYESWGGFRALLGITVLMLHAVEISGPTATATTATATYCCYDYTAAPATAYSTILASDRSGR